MIIPESQRLMERFAELKETARSIVGNGRGILAADESSGTAGKRLASINMENTAENRLAYRRMLFSKAEQLKDHIGGVILHEETVDQIDPSTGLPVTAPLVAAGIHLGIKLDKGTFAIPLNAHQEMATAGLDGLYDRCLSYYNKGCRFAKWRCVYKINVENATPSQQAIEMNASILAQYAAACQAAGLVPIVEPEILMDGNHDLATAASYARAVQAAVFKHLSDHHVYLPGTLLKPNMVVPGQEYSGPKYAPSDIATATISVLAQTVPPAVAGISFLSGGLSEEDATSYLQAINADQSLPHPWRLTFSYARALQSSALKAWNGDDANNEKAATILLYRAQANSQASRGISIASSAKSAAAADGSNKESLFVKDYAYWLTCTFPMNPKYYVVVLYAIQFTFQML